MYLISRNLREKYLRRQIKQFYFFNLLLIYTFFSGVTFWLINRTQPLPYIDEIFHIPQGISYVRGNFTEWNPKITTLPGLYLVTSLVFNVVAYVGSVPLDTLCKPFYLRLLNLGLSVFILHSVYSILTFDDFSTRKVLKPKKAFWITLNISLFPISYMFHHFYYTETLATLLVLMMYRQHLLKNFGKAALLGICAIMVRQTNVIWVGYLIIDELLNICQKMLRKKRSHLSNPLKAFRKLLADRLLKIFVSHFLKNSRYYFMVCFLFIIFLIMNNGIVVGDKEAHVPVFHLCQLFYFSLFMLIFGFPHFFSSFHNFWTSLIENKMIYLISLVISLIVIHFNTMVHPYLLADNRHYTFYFWKRVFEKHYLVKYLLAPVYIFGIHSISYHLDVFRLIQFWVCTFLCLVPQKLLELRYFIIPYMILRLEISFNSSWNTILELFWFVLINCLALYIFVTKEFYWSDSPAIQRIIW